MSLEQYNSLMGSMLNQQHALAKLRAEIEGRKERMCWGCRKFGHLARNCRNKEEEEKRGITLQNKFKVLSSRVIQCDVKERMIRKQKMMEVECFKYGEKGHKCRECPLWKGEKKLQVEEEVVCVAMSQKAQQKEWKRSLVHILQQRAQEHCEEGIPDKACLLELGWHTKEVIVLYVECEKCGQKGCHIEENKGQRVILDRQKWCGCQKKKETEAVYPRRGKAQQSGTRAGVPEGAAKEGGKQREVR